VRKHEIGQEEKIVELYPNKDDIEMAHYIKKLKEHEERRASFNERMDYWKTYKKYLKGQDPETGFDMNNF
jgi:hypothetical protein